MGNQVSVPAEGKNPKRSRKYPIDVEALLCCITLLGETEESFRVGLEAFRRKKIVGNAGPSEKTWRTIVNTGEASASFYVSILKHVKQRLGAEHEAGQLDPGKTPLPLTLANWGSAWERLKKEIKRG